MFAFYLPPFFRRNKSTRKRKEKEMRKISIGLSRVVIIVLITIVLTSGIVIATSPTQPFTINRGIYPSAVTKTIWEEDGTYFEKNQYGVIEYSGTDAETIAISAANSIGSSGGNLHFAKGTYPFTDSLHLTAAHNNIEISGEGQNTVFQVADDAVMPIFIDGTLNCYLHDFMIDGNKDNFDTGVAGFYIGANMYSIFKNIYIENCTNDGLYFQYAQRTMFESIFIRDCDGYGFHAYNSAGETSLTNIFIYDSGLSGMFLDSVDYWECINIEIVGSGENGLYLDHTGEYACSYNTFTNLNVLNNNHLEATGEGILLNGAYCCQFHNTVGYDDQETPTQRRGASFINADHCFISGIFSTNTQFGVYMEGGTYNVFTGQAFNNGDEGIYIYSGTGNRATSAYNDTSWIS